jgi:hypothetical protein
MPRFVDQLECGTRCQEKTSQESDHEFGHSLGVALIKIMQFSRFVGLNLKKSMLSHKSRAGQRVRSRTEIVTGGPASHSRAKGQLARSSPGPRGVERSRSSFCTLSKKPAYGSQGSFVGMPSPKGSITFVFQRWKKTNISPPLMEFALNKISISLSPSFPSNKISISLSPSFPSSCLTWIFLDFALI